MIAIHDLSLIFTVGDKKLQALEGISLSADEGEVIGIAGESGSGKSVLAKSLLRLLPHTAHLSGKIIYRGKDLLTLPEREMRQVRGKQIGLITQDSLTGLNPTKRIYKQITEGLRHHFPNISRKSAKERARQLLLEVGIDHIDAVMNAYPHMLSGGMRQRVMIAAALAPEPDLLIADETTTSLDVTIQAQILTLLKTLRKKRNMTMFFISHDLRLLSEFCDRTVIMYAGNIVESATTRELFTNPGHPYTQKLLAIIPDIAQPKKNLSPIPGSPPNLLNPQPGCPFAPRCSRATPLCHETKPQLTATPHAISCHHQEVSDALRS